MIAKPAGPPAVSDAAQRGGRGLLASAGGTVTAELVPLGIDAAGARYELRVTNGTDGTLAATASALRSDERRPVAALAVEIEPQAAIRTGFALDARLAYERVSAEIYGAGVHLIVEAAPPRGGRPRRAWVPPATALGVAAALAGSVLVVFGVQRPRVLEAGLVATHGGALIAQWRTQGAGRRSYELRNASGTVIAQGALPEPQGALSVGQGDAATLHVAISNAFGSDARDAAYARATPPPPVRIVATPPPRIASLAVDPLRPNAPLVVRYRAQARAVELAIVDRDGAAWFRTTAPGGEGVAQIPAPPAGPREPYALVATAAGQSADQQTRVPVSAALAPTPQPQASAAAAVVPAPGAPAVTVHGAAPGGAAVIDLGGGADFSIRPDPVAPGRPFAVEVPYAGGARVTLVRDRDGAELAGATLHGGERTAALIAPAGGGTYTVRVLLQRGEGSETLVHALHLSPH